MLILSQPSINPIALNFGFIHIYWYGLMYLFSFVFAFYIGKRKLNKSSLMDKEDFYKLILYCIIGVVIGGRLGYFLFYDMSNISDFLLFENGGMSFHGGLSGVIMAVFIYSIENKKDFLKITDFIAPLVPFGLGAGRIGNFINGELWGRVSDSYGGMIFSKARNLDYTYVKNNPHLMEIFYKYNGLPRYPSQLLEFFLEGIVLFIIITVYSKKERKKGRISGVFLLCYGLFRIFIEFFREPDEQLGFFFNVISMGQLLSLPLLLAGLYLLTRNITE